jgi:hypothetical protein
LLTLFPIFANGGKFTVGVIDVGGNLPPLLTTPTELMANLPPLSLILVVHLYLRISKRIFEKITPNIIFNGLGEGDS